LSQVYIFEDEGKLNTGKYRRFVESDSAVVGEDGQIDNEASKDKYSEAVSNFVSKVEKAGWPRIFLRDLNATSSLIMLPDHGYFLVSGGSTGYYRRFEDLASARAALDDSNENGWTV